MEWRVSLVDLNVSDPKFFATRNNESWQMNFRNPRFVFVPRAYCGSLIIALEALIPNGPDYIPCQATAYQTLSSIQNSE